MNNQRLEVIYTVLEKHQNMRVTTQEMPLILLFKIQPLPNR